MRVRPEARVAGHIKDDTCKTEEGNAMRLYLQVEEKRYLEGIRFYIVHSMFQRVDLGSPSMQACAVSLCTSQSDVAYINTQFYQLRTNRLEYRYLGRLCIFTVRQYVYRS